MHALLTLTLTLTLALALALALALTLTWYGGHHVAPDLIGGASLLDSQLLHRGWRQPFLETQKVYTLIFAAYFVLCCVLFCAVYVVSQRYVAMIKIKSNAMLCHINLLISKRC
jgi:hypothetical protein